MYLNLFQSFQLNALVVSSLATGNLLKLAAGSFSHELDLSLITSLFSSITSSSAPDLEFLQRVPFREKYYLENSNAKNTNKKVNTRVTGDLKN